MHLQCVCSDRALLAEVVSLLLIEKNVWVTLTFPSSSEEQKIFLQADGGDHNSTVKAALPLALFSFYSCDERVQFQVHLRTFQQALSVMSEEFMFPSRKGRGEEDEDLRNNFESVCLEYSTDTRQFTVMKPDPTSRWAGGADMNLREGDYSVKSVLTTRWVQSKLLDLEFGKSKITAEIEVDGSSLRDVVEDFDRGKCEDVSVIILRPSNGSIDASGKKKERPPAVLELRGSSSALSLSARLEIQEEGPLDEPLEIQSSTTVSTALMKIAGGRQRTSLTSAGGSRQVVSPLPAIVSEKLIIQTNEMEQLRVGTSLTGKVEAKIEAIIMPLVKFFQPFDNFADII